MNTSISTKDLIDKNLATRKSALFNLVLFTGPIKKSDLIQFYQVIHETHRNYNLYYPLDLLNREKKLTSTKDTVSPYLPKALLNTTSSLSFSKCLKFLMYLIQLRDERGKFIYYKAINNICRLDRYPDVMLCSIDNILYYIQYCPSNQINEYNDYINARDKETNTTSNNIRRILVSDEGLKRDDVNVNGIVNIVTIDSDDNIKVIK